MALPETARVALAEREIELVVAVTPTGPLAHAIDAYRQAVAVRIGKNTAHETPPHCVVVRSYHDRTSSVRAYRQALAANVVDGWRQRRHIAVTALATESSWHGLEIDSPSLRALALKLASSQPASIRANEVRIECHLRLVLAAGFESADCDALTELAHRIVDPALPARWDVGLWQRAHGAWTTIWSEAAG